MSSQLVPLGAALPARRSANIAPVSRMRSGAGIQTSSGSVSAFFSLEHFDRRSGVATYALRVINRTKSSLVCRTWIIGHSGEPVLAYPTFFEIDPYSTNETRVPVWPKDFPSFERAIAEVAGNGVHCVVEAAAPVQPKRGKLYSALAAGFIAAGLLTVFASLALRGAIPRIAAFAVTPQALPGTTVEAQYNVSGSGALSYVVIAPDGRRIAGGPLHGSAGSIFIPIPQAPLSGAYAIRLGMNGPLGSASDTRVVNAVQVTNTGAQITDVSVHPVVAKPGAPIEVAYSAVGEGGYVRLVGTDGTIWSQRPFSRTGQTRLVVPPFGDSRELHVVVRATKGQTAAQTVAGVFVNAPARPIYDAAAAPADGAAVADDPGGENGTFAVSTRSVHSGDAIVVRIISPRNDMRIALTDAQSHEIVATDASGDAQTVTLRAPSVTAATRDTIVATFTDAFGQESIVEPVTILP